MSGLRSRYFCSVLISEILSLRSFSVFRVRGIPVEERRKPIHGGLGGGSLTPRHPRQAHSAPFFILKLGIAGVDIILPNLIMPTLTI